jgi:hypothetical protein
VDDSCCWCCGEGDDKFEGQWDVPKEVAFCKWFGTQIVDFREAKWPERVYEHTVKVKARTACGYVKVRSSVRRSALTRISLTSRANTRVHVDTHTHLTPHLSARPTPCSPENSYTVSPCHIAPHAAHRLLFQMRGSRSTRSVPAVSRVGYGVGGIGVTSMTRRSVPLWFPVLAVVVGVGVDVGGGLVCHCNLYLLSFPPAYLSLLPALVGYRVGPSVVSCAVVLTWCCDRALQGIALCMFAWWGCVQVYTASEWEKQNPSEDDDNRSQATGGPPDSPVVSSQPNSQHSI